MSYPGGIGLSMYMGKLGAVPDPPEYPEFEGCPFDYSDVDGGEECGSCEWHSTCKYPYGTERLDSEEGCG